MAERISSVPWWWLFIFHIIHQHTTKINHVCFIINSISRRSTHSKSLNRSLLFWITITLRQSTIIIQSGYTYEYLKHRRINSSKLKMNRRRQDDNWCQFGCFWALGETILNAILLWFLLTDSFSNLEMAFSAIMPFKLLMGLILTLRIFATVLLATATAQVSVICDVYCFRKTLWFDAICFQNRMYLSFPYWFLNVIGMNLYIVSVAYAAYIWYARWRLECNLFNKRKLIASSEQWRDFYCLKTFYSLY